MKSICVYSGAASGNSVQFQEAVVSLGKYIAQSDLRLVYGGSSLGLMGLLATTVVDLGGKVTGIIPECLMSQEKPSSILDELIITKNMQERKLLMQQKADAFIVMPGGFGTLEEAFDTLNAIKIGVLHKPIGFLNIDGYFDDLFSFFSAAKRQGFISEKASQIPYINKDLSLLLSQILAASITELEPNLS